MEKVLDSGLIARSLDFHGQQLKKVWETERGEGDLQKLNVENVDFSVFQERQKHMGFQDRGKRLKLHQFIAKHANVLFDEVLNVRCPPASGTASQSSGDAAPSSPHNHHYAILPPFDSFLDIEKKDRTQHFCSCLKAGDLIMGQLVSKISTGYMMKIFCSEGDTTRVVADLGVKAIIQSVNMIPAVDKKNVSRSFLINDLVCCEVLEVVASSEKIYAGMKGDVCPPRVRLQLGLIQNEDMPPAYMKWQEGMTESYDEMLQNSIGFRNPGNIKCLSEELGLGNQNFSHFPSLRFGFPTEECASELRQAQSSKWAYRSVSDGIAHFKAGRHAEAFQCLNKALTIDANNIEALVARGALFANGGSFKKAIEDFDAALKINSNHQNARKYMAETLVAHGRSFEEENKWDEAMAAYERCLTIVPYHEEARNSIEYVKAKQGLNRQPESETIPLLTPGKAQGVKETLKQLLAQQETKSKKSKKKKDKKAKRKKNRSSSSSSSSSLSSSSSSSSSSTDSSSASSQDSHHKRKHKRKGEHKDRSLSPLSKRMALMDSVGGIESFDGSMPHKGSHYNPPSMPYSFTSRPEATVPVGDAMRGLSGKSSVESEYEARVKKFLEQTKGDDDYEEKVRKFLEETAKWKKERKAQEEKKKKKKKDKKASKKNRKKKREERKKLKKAAKEEKMRREGKRRRSNSNLEEDDLYGSKTDISRLISLENIPDLEDLQSKLSAYYAKVEKGPKKRELNSEKTPHKQKQSASPKSNFDSNERGSSHEPPRKDSLSPIPEREKSTNEAQLQQQPQQKFKMQLGTIPTKLKKKDSKVEDNLPETWDDVEEKGSILIKEVAPPPPPPTKDEMAQDLKKKVEKKKEAIEAKVPAPSMDILGGFIINQAVVTNNLAKEAESSGQNHQKHKGGGRGGGSDTDSDMERKDKRSTSSRSRSRSPTRKKYSVSESSGSSYKMRPRSRSKSGSYTRPRRYRSSESASYRSRSYSRSRSRSRSGDYGRRSRSRSDDRNYRNKYPGRYPRNRGTYYRPRFQNSSGNYKSRGYGGSRGGYRNNRGQNYRDYRDYRRGGFPRSRGRGRGGGGGGPRYFHYRPRERDYRRYDRGSRSDDDRDDSPMRKVDAAKERIDKMIAEDRHTGPLSDGEERDDDYVDRKEYDGKWGANKEEAPNQNDDKA